MSAHDHAAVAVIGRIATLGDGAVVGIGLAICAAGSWIRYIISSSALRRIKDAPSVSIADIRSVLSSNGEYSDGGEGLVVVRGRVQPKTSFEVGFTGVKNIGGSLLSDGSGERAVIVQQIQTYLYNERSVIFGWRLDLMSMLAKSWKQQSTSFLRSVPFILVEGDNWPNSGFVNVSFDGSTHPLPLTTVHQRLHPVQATASAFFQLFYGNGYPVALLDEEKILQVGKEITAVGICRTNKGALEIRSCPDLPCFLSDKTKDEIEADLAIDTRILFWSGIVLGTLSIGILGYAVVRNWSRWKEWRQRRRHTREPHNEMQVQGSNDEESGDIPDGQLCVICLMRQRRSAFVPCGHLVCCHRCALSVEQDSLPKCHVCRQSIRSSIRIYDS